MAGGEVSYTVYHAASLGNSKCSWKRITDFWDLLYFSESCLQGPKSRSRSLAGETMIIPTKSNNGYWFCMTVWCIEDEEKLNTSDLEVVFHRQQRDDHEDIMNHPVFLGRSRNSNPWVLKVLNCGSDTLHSFEYVSSRTNKSRSSCKLDLYFLNKDKTHALSPVENYNFKGKFNVI